MPPNVITESSEALSEPIFFLFLDLEKKSERGGSFGPQAENMIFHIVMCKCVRFSQLDVNATKSTEISDYSKIF